VTDSESESIIIVSSDSHVGPRAQELHDYIPAKYRRQFEDFIAEQQQYVVFTPTAGKNRRHELNMKTEGHHDPYAYLRDMDRDGIAAQVIFHGSQNGEPFPLGHRGVVDARLSIPAEQLEANAAGIHAYNAWLADFCSVAPERLVGLAHLPVWDVELAVKELEWVVAHGLRGVNWPSPRPWISEYDDETWDPLWACAAANQMHLNTHSGAPAPGIYGVPGNMILPRANALMEIESGGWPSRRGVARMIFGGAFQRYPDLKLVLTEQMGTWWQGYLREIDQAWEDTPEVHELLPKPPSEYFLSNVFIGASFMANFEANIAYEDGIWSTFIWGSDYPHREGTWAYSEDPDEPNRTQLAIRDAVAGLPERLVRAMIGETGVRAYGLDRGKLASIAARIQAPTIIQIMAPISDSEQSWIERFTDPEQDYTTAFRRPGAWARSRVLSRG
jgi:predicted TIM-barrel fold metal-dependent hydrolase